MLGLGIALFFMPILTILLSDLEGPEIAEGSGSATFLRTVGASSAPSIVTHPWTPAGALRHATPPEHTNAYNPEVRHGVAAMGGALQRYAAEVNGVITQQGMQVSFNHIFDGLGFCFFALIAVVWLSKPPFIARGPVGGGH
jgi:DHA2 family multidrug resistance protein